MQFSFDNDYFKDEEIDGFLVTEAMKRYWAASLKTLCVFDDICKKHDIKWWADWGTLLGAVRHKGFIPWDDDIDLGIMRKDHQRFIEIAQSELPEGYEVINYDCEVHKYSGITVVLNHRAVSFDEKVLDEYYQCPFPVGFDLYPYDYYPKDPKDRAGWRLDGIKYLVAMEHIRTGGVSSQEAKKAIMDIGPEALKLSANCNKEEVLVRFAKKVESIAGRFDDDTADRLMLYTYFIRDNNERYIDKEWVAGITDISFMGGSIPAPSEYDKVLSRYYGSEYTTPRRSGAAHEYPLYNRDIRSMIGFLEQGGMKLSDLPPQLRYILREADIRGIAHK